ncbi:cupin domain-containing protein [Candidatus Laterigemmans baculatus]|uniref:cupin domain-containing protein n=1 Tax=Candidatus Laterigemmans baculatus TaxID=2770505 RepID=UPI0028F43F94|nr:cupin domain-containing protein [Candidatus Laterigemmans baculatus]
MRSVSMQPSIREDLSTHSPPPEVVDLASLPGVACPCGVARRAFAERSDFPATVHLTEISTAARTHYHRHSTETYVVLECGPGAAIELDGVPRPVQPGVAVLIPPGVRHRAVGEMKVIIFCLPKFDPSDEHFD